MWYKHKLLFHQPDVFFTSFYCFSTNIHLRPQRRGLNGLNVETLNVSIVKRMEGCSLLLNQCQYEWHYHQPIQILITLCPAHWSWPLVQQDLVHTSRRVSLHWPLLLSEALGGSGSCEQTASNPNWCPEVLRVTQPPQKHKSVTLPPQKHKSWMTA